MDNKQMPLQGNHPLVILCYLCGTIAATMLSMHVALLVCSFAWGTAVAIYCKGSEAVKNAALVAVPVLFFTVVILPLFNHNGVTPLFYVNGMAVTKVTMVYGLVMTLLLTGVFQWFQVWNVVLDSEKFLYLFGRILPSVGLFLSMVFRMLPLMRQHFKEIQNAQKGLGRRDENISFLGKCKLVLKEISTLISWSLENSMETAISMESRGYGTGKRTSFHLFRFSVEDALWCMAYVILFGNTIVQLVMGKYRAWYFPDIQMQPIDFWGWTGLVTFTVAALLPVLCVVKQRWNTQREEEHHGTAEI